MNKSENIAALSKALAKAQNEVENAGKNASNPHFRSKYADLAEVLNTVRPIFSSNGLAISQFPSFENGIASVETIITHESGEWMSGISSAPVSKQDAQGVGSATTYLRRYSLAAIAGIAQEDDDGNSAIGKNKKPEQPKQPENPDYADYCADYQEQIAAIKIGINKKDYKAAADAWNTIPEEAKLVLWRAPSNGGCFTTEERAIMKTSEFREAAIK